MKLKSMIMSMILVLAFVSVFSPVVFADEYDINYSGKLDLSDSEDEEEDVVTKNTSVYVTNGFYYNTDDSLYYFKSSDNNAYYTSNVCDGMVTQSKVTINAPKGSNVTLYRDGAEFTGDITNITRPGSYVFQYKTNSGNKEQLLFFTIIGTSTGLINEFSVPNGFELVKATKDKETISVYGKYISLEEEGSYTIAYKCSNTGREYSLEFVVDHTPPVLALSDVKDGKAWGPVDLSDLEQGASITVTRDGEPETIEDNQLTKSGHYILKVTDAASNTTEYKFTIMIYFNVGSFAFLGVILLIIVGFVAYLVISKRKLRIR